MARRVDLTAREAAEPVRRRGRVTHGCSTAVRTMGTPWPVPLETKSGETGDRTSHESTRRTVSGIGSPPDSRPGRLTDEHSRGKVQNVGGVVRIGAHPVA